MFLPIANRIGLSSTRVLPVLGVVVPRFVWRLKRRRRSVFGPNLGPRWLVALHPREETFGVATPAWGPVRWLPANLRFGFGKSRPTVDRRPVCRSLGNLGHRRWSGFPGSTRGWPASSFKMSFAGRMKFVGRFTVERRSVASLHSFRRDEQTGETGAG